MRVLILEKNQFMLSIIEAALKVYDFEAHKVSSLIKAELYFKEHAPDIVIGDLLREEGTSCDFLQLLARKPDLKVLVLTSKSSCLQVVNQRFERPNWFFVSKDNRLWLFQINQAIESFFGESSGVNYFWSLYTDQGFAESWIDHSPSLMFRPATTKV